MRVSWGGSEQNGPLTQRALLAAIRKALKAVDMMKILEGKQALGNKQNTKDLGEHKVGCSS